MESESRSCRELIRINRPYIEKVLVVDDVLGYFPDWTQNLVEKIRSLPTRTERAREFLSCLLSIEDGAPFTRRFKQFLDALKHANYQPLSRLLSGETIKKCDTFRKTLKTLQPAIEKRVVIDVPLLNELLARYVITEEEKEQIWSEVEHGNRRQGLDLLISSLPRRQVDWPDQFSEALQKTGNEGVLAIIFDIGDDHDVDFDRERIRQKNEAFMTSVVPDCFRSTGVERTHDSSFSDSESFKSLPHEEPQTCAKTLNFNNLSPGHSLEIPEDNVLSSLSSERPDTDSASSLSQASFDLNFVSYPEDTVAVTAMRLDSFDSSGPPSFNSTPGKSKMYEKDLHFQIKTRDIQRLCSTDDESREHHDVDSGPMSMPSSLQTPTVPETNRGQGHRRHSRGNGDTQHSQLHVQTRLPESSRPPQYNRRSPESPNIPNVSQNRENSMQAHESVSLGQNLGNIDQIHQVTQNLPQKLGSMSLPYQNTPQYDQEQHSHVQQMSDRSSVRNQFQNPHNYTAGQIQSRPTVPQEFVHMPFLDQGTAKGLQAQHSRSKARRRSDRSNVQNPPPCEEVSGSNALATGQITSVPASDMRHPCGPNIPSANRQKKALARPNSGPSPAPPKTSSVPVNPVALRTPRPNSQKENIKQVVKPKKETLSEAVYPASGSFDDEDITVQARGITPKPKKDEKAFSAAARGSTPKTKKECLPSAVASSHEAGVAVQGKNRSSKVPDLDMGVWTVLKLPKQPGMPTCSGCKGRVFKVGELGIKVKGRRKIEKNGKSTEVVRFFWFCPVASCLHNINREKVILEPPKALDVPSYTQLSAAEKGTLARLQSQLRKM